MQASRRLRKPLRFARLIDKTPGLTFAGLLMYPTETGWNGAQKFYDETLTGLRQSGLNPGIVSTGGSPNLKNVGQLKGATEHRPGTYLQRPHAGRRWRGVVGRLCAPRLFHRGQPRAAPGRGILDAGSKTPT